MRKTLFFLMLPAALAAAAPVATTSRYIQTTSSSVLYAEGKAMAQAGKSGLVVLDFGQPWVQSGVYGVWLFGANSFRSTSQIATAVENFLRGYYDYSTAGMFVKVGIGTNNYHGATGNAHGQAWGRMVNSVNSWVSTNGLSRVQARGANDIEPWLYESAGPEPASITRAWVDGYSSVTSAPMYNFGSCDGCPPYGDIDGDWTREDVWYWSWGNPTAWPLPEIYGEDGANAVQWQYMSRYAYDHHGQRMDFLGPMTQYGSCPTEADCPMTRNTPAQGWSFLYNELKRDPVTAQALDYSTDITWAN